MTLFLKSSAFIQPLSKLIEEGNWACYGQILKGNCLDTTMSLQQEHIIFLLFTDQASYFGPKVRKIYAEAVDKIDLQR